MVPAASPISSRPHLAALTVEQIRRRAEADSSVASSCLQAEAAACSNQADYCRAGELPASGEMLAVAAAFPEVSAAQAYSAVVFVGTGLPVLLVATAPSNWSAVVVVERVGSAPAACRQTTESRR